MALSVFRILRGCPDAARHHRQPDATAAKDALKRFPRLPGNGPQSIDSPDPTYADAILDRLINNAYRINLKGKTMRDVIDPTTGVALDEKLEIGEIGVAPADG